MPRLRSLQTNFTSGELDPLLRGRIDVKHYYNGAELASHVKMNSQTIDETLAAFALGPNIFKINRGC